MNPLIENIYGNQLRARACGLCIEKDQLLMVNHIGITTGDFWAAPGGGIQFGESANDCLKREFLEETGLEIEVCDFLFACEFINQPLHAIELFFVVKKLGGQLVTGKDPESGSNQIITNVRFMEWSKIKTIEKAHLHGIFLKVQRIEEIIQLRGYFKL
jgi:8-oxo-dGTP diphosphatase